MNIDSGSYIQSDAEEEKIQGGRVMSGDQSGNV